MQRRNATGVLDEVARRPAAEPARGGDRWSPLPAAVSSTPRDVPAPIRELVAIALCTVGPLLRSVDMADSKNWLIVTVGVVANVVLWALGGRLPVARLVVPVLAGGALMFTEGKFVALWVAVALVLCEWTLRRRPPLPRLARPDAAVGIPVTVLLGMAAWRGSDPDQTRVPLLFLIAAVAIVLVESSGARPIDRLTRRIGRGASDAITMVTFSLLGVVGVAVPWVIQRVFRLDPLLPMKGASPTWIRRGRRNIRRTQPFADDAPIGERTPYQKFRFLLSFAPFVVLLGAGTVAMTSSKGDPGPPVIEAAPGLSNAAGQQQQQQEQEDGGEPTIPAAFKDADWYPQYIKDTTWMTNQRTGVWLPLNAQRIADVKTQTVNVRDGVRVSWEPPACGCKRLKVWIYGGSTMFGIGQRDEHTIASEFARAAWAKGIAVDVVNRGVLGHLHWMEADRFAWDLTFDPKPDLVIFYDGANEIWAAQKIQTLGTGDSRSPTDPLVEEIWKGMKIGGPEPPPTPAGASLLTKDNVSLSPEETGALAVTRYDRSRGMSAGTAKAYDIPIEYFWQPSRLDRPSIPGETKSSDANAERAAHETYAKAASLVPPDVHNLSKVFDGNDDPIFNDDVHTNEEGARIIAQAMFDAELPKLQFLAAGP